MPQLYTTELLYTDFTELSLLLTVQPSKMAEAGAEYVNHQVWMVQGMINDMLRHKYFVPYTTPGPVPPRVKFWIARIVTPKVVERTQLDPTDVMYLRFVEDAKLAWEEIKAEAASDVNSLPLPVAANNTAAIVTGYSQYDPKTWYRVQGERARDERQKGGGGTIL